MTIPEDTFSRFIKRVDTCYKNDECRMTWRGFGCVCVKIEPASYKNNEILEINVL